MHSIWLRKNGSLPLPLQPKPIKTHRRRIRIIRLAHQSGRAAHISQRVPQRSARTAVIAPRLRRRTIQQLLGAQRDQLPGAPEHLALDRHRNGERVARTARLLVLRAGDEAALAPVERRRQLGVHVADAQQPGERALRRCGAQQRRSIFGRVLRRGGRRFCCCCCCRRWGAALSAADLLLFVGGGGVGCGIIGGVQWDDFAAMAAREADVRLDVLLVALELLPNTNTNIWICIWFLANGILPVLPC